MRCDSALNPDLPRERQEAHLLRVGDGAEQLLHLIEHGLEPFRVHPSTMVEASIPPRFFVELEEEMSPIFGPPSGSTTPCPGQPRKWSLAWMRFEALAAEPWFRLKDPA